MLCITPFVLFDLWVVLPQLPTFPTRRSSDLMPTRRRSSGASSPSATARHLIRRHLRRLATSFVAICDGSPPRSEEHTSELQSRRDLVCRLLLEKKNPESGLANGVLPFHAFHF